jgi:hypothetical protein
MNVNAADRINGDGATEMPGQPVDESGRRMIWSFNGARWHRVLDTTPLDNGSVEDQRAKFADAGFFYVGSFGAEHGTFAAEVYQDEKGCYVILLSIGDVVETIKAESFPALLALLKELTPLFAEGRLES